jgi:hypothetical protein
VGWEEEAVNLRKDVESVVCEPTWVLSGIESEMKPLIDYFYRRDGECPEGAWYELSDPPDDDEPEGERELIVHLKSHHLPFLTKLLGLLHAGGGQAARLGVYFGEPQTANLRAEAWINGLTAEHDGQRATISIDRATYPSETEQAIIRAIRVLFERE